ncbi:MAG: D-2-hydroxyacid dehydrogenase family protein [Dehalococcoidia bacterium]|nr:D-2-hydroxyacid dehydrogenase family protein [Dehalococcoidia bacterium]
MKIAVLDDYQQMTEGTEPVQRLRSRTDVELTVFHEPLAPGKARSKALRGVEVVLPFRERTAFDAAFFRDAPDLRLIAQSGNITVHIDRAAAKAASVRIALGQAGGGGGGNPAAELAIGLILSVLRRIPESDRVLRTGRWDQLSGLTLHGRTLGLVGLGRVGTATAQFASAFGMRLLTWSRNMTPERAAAVGATAVGLDELLQTADVVSIHLALTPETRGMIDERKLRLMRPGAFLVNTARAAIVDEAALVRMLQEGAIAGAGLDVFSEEPLPADSPLIGLNNVVLTAHIGYPVDTFYAGWARATVQRVEEYLEGTLTNVLDLEVQQA